MSLTTTNRRRKGGQFIVQAKALPGNPYDGHTLKPVRAETGELTGRKIERADVDKGCQGHDAPGAIQVFKSGHKRGVHAGSGRSRGGDWLLQDLDERGATAVIPPKSNRKGQRDDDTHMYK